MQEYSIGELKTRFSEVIGQLKKGQEIIISYGKKKQKIGVIIPYNNYSKRPERKLGLLKGVGSCIIHEDFKISDRELLSS